MDRDTEAFDMNIAEAREFYYNHLHLKDKGINEPRWRGVHVVKFPTDLILYAQAIFENQPDYIVETGTKYGGSSMFFADMLSLVGGTGVITVDIRKREIEPDPMIERIVGDSSDPKVAAQILDMVKGKVMVVLDSDHKAMHVWKEMKLFGPLVTKGQFMVVEDCYMRDERLRGPGKAVEWFLKRSNSFRRETPEDAFIFAVTRGGWLRRI